MRPFNLEEAKAGKPIQLRDGRPCFFVAYEPRVSRPLLVGVGGYIHTRHTNGCIRSDEDDSKFDVVMAPVKHVGWVVSCLNSYKERYMISPIFESEAEALKVRLPSTDKPKIMKVEWEE